MSSKKVQGLEENIWLTHYVLELIPTLEKIGISELKMVHS